MRVRLKQLSADTLGATFPSWIYQRIQCYVAATLRCPPETLVPFDLDPRRNWNYGSRDVVFDCTAGFYESIYEKKEKKKRVPRRAKIRKTELIDRDERNEYCNARYLRDFIKRSCTKRTVFSENGNVYLTNI